MVGTFVSRAVAVFASGRRPPGPVALVRRLGFWIAVVFPLVYLAVPLFDLPGLPTHLAVAGSVCLHGVALGLGHGYDPSGDGK